jgi:type IV pilus assembly protein PilA
MFSLIHKRMKGEKGFTLIELLVVIIIIAILAAIAIPTFLGQRQKAQDSAAKSLVRNAMTAIESAYVDLRTFAPATMTAAVLTAIEPSIVFAAAAATGVAGNPSSAATANTVDYFGTADTYEVGTVSESTKEFSVFVNKTAAAVGTNDPGNTFYVGAVEQKW